MWKIPVSLIPSFVFYAFISGITPGPANLYSLASVLNYGRKAALRQWLGLLTGFIADAAGAVLVCYFLGTVMGEYVRILSWVGACYIVWLALRILRSSGTHAASDGECCFRSGFLLNITNVKIILFCVNALSSFVLPYSRSFASLALLGCFLPIMGPLSNLVWIFAGDALRNVFERHRKPVNIIMAASLVLCAFGIVKDELALLF